MTTVVVDRIPAGMSAIATGGALQALSEVYGETGVTLLTRRGDDGAIEVFYEPQEIAIDG